MKAPVLTVAALYAATVPAANWMIDNVGTTEFPGGPHVIKVGFGYSAPSGVLMIGVALCARDVLQRLAGRSAALVAIAVGAVVSYLIADPAIAVASLVAFAVGEFADFSVYTPLSRRHLTSAVVASGVVGGVVDTVLFLHIAFGSLDYWQGQVLGKTYMALIGGLLIWAVRRAVPDRFPTRETASVG